MSETDKGRKNVYQDQCNAVYEAIMKLRAEFAAEFCPEDEDTRELESKEETKDDEDKDDE